MKGVLVVCAANICRSPAAASLLTAELAARGLDIPVTSAGVTAVGDRPACDLALALVGTATRRSYAFEGPDAVHSAAGRHLSRRMSLNEVQSVDLVLVMERWHLEAVSELAPHAKVRLLDPKGDIPDPHAIGYESHAAVFARLRSAVVATAEELLSR